MTILKYSVLALCILSVNLSSCQEKKKNNHKNSIKAEIVTSTANKKVDLVGEMPNKLKEISGIVKDGDFLWAIADNPKADIYKLDLSGNIIQQLHLKNTEVTDVEDVAVDADYLYIGDLGDNDGTRQVRQVIKVKKSAIGTSSETEVEGEVISFSFPAQSGVHKKKKNENDCESLFSYRESLYMFTKRRDDKKTELFMLSKKTGSQVPKAIALFNSKGLVTGAAINAEGNEVALVGYLGGHKHPFIWKLSGFTGNNFFAGKQQEYILNEDERDWQVEGVTYKDANTLFFSNEKTSDFPASIYSITNSQLKSTE